MLSHSLCCLLQSSSDLPVTRQISCKGETQCNTGCRMQNAGKQGLLHCDVCSSLCLNKCHHRIHLLSLKLLVIALLDHVWPIHTFHQVTNQRRTRRTSACAVWEYILNTSYTKLCQAYDVQKERSLKEFLQLGWLLCTPLIPALNIVRHFTSGKYIIWLQCGVLQVVTMIIKEQCLRQLGH